MTATYQIVKIFGWEYLEKLAKQKVMQVQSATDPPKKLALGERAVMADGNEYNLVQLKEAGAPVEVVYPEEGTPVVNGPSGVFASAPNPNAARLFQNWLHGLEAQQLLVDFAAQHSVHALVKPRPGRKALSRHQGVQGRSRRRRKGRRRDQGALHADIQGVNVTIALGSRATSGSEPTSICSWPILIGFAAVLCVLVLLPMAGWSITVSTTKAGAFTLGNFGDAGQRSGAFSSR